MVRSNRTCNCFAGPTYGQSIPSTFPPCSATGLMLILTSVHFWIESPYVYTVKSLRPLNR